MTNVLEIDPVTNEKFYKAGTDMLFKSVFSDEKNRDLLENIIEVTVGKKDKNNKTSINARNNKN